MNMFEDAVMYATVMHAGEFRKDSKTPYILHPLEVAQIISTITDDIEVMTAGVLHDIVEDTVGTNDEISKRFGARVAALVASETEDKMLGMSKEASWLPRKQESIRVLQNSTDIGVKILWLADKLANIRSLAHLYAERGDEIWNIFHQADPKLHQWYYKSVAEAVELELNRTGAYKEFIKHINYVWPNTIKSAKERYKKYREYSVDDLTIIGKGAKSTVYRYDDELVIKVYNENNTYKDIERENLTARKALVAGIPTAISFGIVSVGKNYGTMFELLESDTVSSLIARDISRVDYYAEQMADLARLIHSTDGSELELPDFTREMYNWVDDGLGHLDSELASGLHKLIDNIAGTTTLIHGDFHTGNVMIQKGEPYLIDMDRLSTCHPIAELCGLYMFYIGFGKLNPSMIESFMGFSCEVAKQYYDTFLRRYLDTDDVSRLNEVTDKAALMCYVRLLRRAYEKRGMTDSESATATDYCLKNIRELITRVDTLDF